MRYDVLELKRIMKRGIENITVDEEIKYNILNFIDCIHANKQDFFRDSFDSKFFGDLEMIFRKAPNCLFGYCRADIKSQGRSMEFIFNEHGFELLEEVLKK